MKADIVSSPLGSASPTSKIVQRIAALETWLRENAPEVAKDQRHLDADTVERAYWHYGYVVALRDVLKLLGRELH